jgi:hypothetical protein
MIVIRGRDTEGNVTLTWTKSETGGKSGTWNLVIDRDALPRTISYEWTTGEVLEVCEYMGLTPQRGELNRVETRGRER